MEVIIAGAFGQIGPKITAITYGKGSSNPIRQAIKSTIKPFLTFTWRPQRSAMQLSEAGYLEVRTKVPKYIDQISKPKP